MIGHLGPGGAQRVAVNAANALVERGFDVHVVVLNDRPSAYWVDPRVALHAGCPLQVALPDADADDNNGKLATAQDSEESAGRIQPLVPYVRPNWEARLIAIAERSFNPNSQILWLARQTWGLGRRTLFLRRTIQRIGPDSVLSFLTQTNILTVLATRGLQTHTVISERNDPRLQRQNPRVEQLRRLVYRWSNVVTANSRGALDTLEKFVPKEKLAFLPNPVMASATGEVAEFATPTVVTLGRLVEQKGIDVLLAAWAKVAAALPGWRLAIIGDGPLGSELKERARTLGIENSVDWIGHVSDPFPLLRGAEFFVLTSRFEGTPNALLEAMACGLPAVVSDASPGPCELIGIDESRAGLIVPVDDAGATADAIIRLARDETLRRRLGLAARERARAHDADHAIEVWLRLLRCE